MTRTSSVTNTLLGILLAAACHTAASAGAETFTWNPAGASPPLAGAGSAFTADAIDGTHYLYSVAPLPTAPFPQPHYTVDFIERINQFTLGGVPVSTPGLNGTPGASGSYGLYLMMQADTQYVGPPTTYQYHSLDVTLKADPGNNDGAVSSTLSGLAFANTGPTGAGDDIVLAKGSLISGVFSLNPAPEIRSIGHFKETLQAAPGEAGFFVTPLSPFGLIEEVLTTPFSAIRIVRDPSNSNYTITTLNGGTAVVDLRVPEPASLALLSTALGALVVIRRRRASREVAAAIGRTSQGPADNQVDRLSQMTSWGGQDGPV